MTEDPHSTSGSGRRFFTTSEVARYCAVSNDGVLRWIKSGKLQGFATPGGHYRISIEDFRAFLKRYGIPVDEAFFGGDKRERKVLVVDDDPEVRRLVRRLLSELDADLHVEEAADGYEAGIKIGTLRPDLVILDLMMPRVDGISLCRSIRANAETRHIKVLAITGAAEGERIRKAFAAGVNGCATKPLRLDEFRAETRRLLREATRDRSCGEDAGARRELGVERSRE
jgi:excisionase family DNA binding protein